MVLLYVVGMMEWCVGEVCCVYIGVFGCRWWGVWLSFCCRSVGWEWVCEGECWVLGEGGGGGVVDGVCACVCVCVCGCVCVCVCVCV